MPVSASWPIHVPYCHSVFYDLKKLTYIDSSIVHARNLNFPFAFTTDLDLTSSPSAKCIMHSVTDSLRYASLGRDRPVSYASIHSH